MSQKYNLTNLPGSGSFQKKTLDIRLIKGRVLSRDYVHYVIGICGGDCAGKKELINYMFTFDQEGVWLGSDSKQKRTEVTIVQEEYFLQDRENKYNSKGINWTEFEKALLTLFAGNTYTVTNEALKEKSIVLKPSKLLVIEGNHVFMQSYPIWLYMDCKIFIDSDSDVRLSRRIYKDTQDNGIDLNDSIKNYLQNIKPSYDAQIEPCKTTSDIIIPHFGGGYNDHRKKDKSSFDSNVHNAKGLIIALIKEQMSKQVIMEEADE